MQFAQTIWLRSVAASDAMTRAMQANAALWAGNMTATARMGMTLPVTFLARLSEATANGTDAPAPARAPQVPAAPVPTPAAAKAETPKPAAATKPVEAPATPAPTQKQKPSVASKAPKPAKPKVEAAPKPAAKAEAKPAAAPAPKAVAPKPAEKAVTKPAATAKPEAKAKPAPAAPMAATPKPAAEAAPEAPKAKADAAARVVEPTAPKAAAAPAAQTTAAGGRMAQPSNAAPDDLKRIIGIGPKFEKQLNAEGIHRFDQIAAMGTAEIAALDAKIPTFARRAKAGDWVMQAKMLAEG